MKVFRNFINDDSGTFDPFGAILVIALIIAIAAAVYFISR